MANSRGRSAVGRPAARPASPLTRSPRHAPRRRPGRLSARAGDRRPLGGPLALRPESELPRYFGLSNLLETMLLVPAFGGAALLFRRFGWIAFAGTAPGVRHSGREPLRRRRRRRGRARRRPAARWSSSRGRPAGAAISVGAAGVTLGLVALDAATWGSSHVTKALEDGPVGLAGDRRAGRAFVGARDCGLVRRACGGADAGCPRTSSCEPLRRPDARASRLSRWCRPRSPSRSSWNDSPTDVPRRSHELCGRRRGYASRAMARYFALLVAVLALAVVAGCGGGGVVAGPRP